MRTSKDPTTAVANIPLEMPNFFADFFTEGVGVTSRKELIILIIYQIFFNLSTFVSHILKLQ